MGVTCWMTVKTVEPFVLLKNGRPVVPDMLQSFVDPEPRTNLRPGIPFVTFVTNVGAVPVPLVSVIVA